MSCAWLGWVSKPEFNSSWAWEGVMSNVAHHEPEFPIDDIIIDMIKYMNK